MHDTIEITEYHKGPHQHDKSPSHYGLMYHFDDFSVSGTTKMTVSRPVKTTIKTELSTSHNNLNDSRRFMTPERSLPTNQYPDTVKSPENNSA